MCQIDWGGRIRFSILEENYSTVINSDTDVQSQPEHMRARHLFEIWVAMSLSPHKQNVYVVFLTGLGVCLW
jgi:hypothetical protein